MATPVFFTGFEAGVVSASGGGLASAIAGAVTVETSPVATGSYALKCAATVSTSATYTRTVTANNIMVVQFKVYIPSAETQSGYIAQMRGGGAGTRYLYYYPSDGHFSYYISGTTVDSATGYAKDTWHTIDLYYNGSTGATDWKINGAAQTQHAPGGSGTMANFDLSCQANANGARTCYYDDLFISQTAGDFPITTNTLGIIGLMPSGAGSSNLDTNIEDNGSVDVNDSTNPANVELDELPLGSGTDYIKQIGGTSSLYAAVAFADTSKTTIIGAMGLVAYRSASASPANSASSRIYDEDGQETAIYTGDMTETSTFYKSAVIRTPNGGWDQAAVNALQGRVGFATDYAPVPYWYGIMVEVAYSEGATNLVPAEGSQDQVGDSPALTQVHVVAPAEGAQDQVGDSQALTQVHNLTPSEGFQLQVGDQATLDLPIPTIIGSAIIDTTHGNGSRSIDIPSDAEGIIVSSWGWTTGVANDFATLNFDGGGKDFSLIERQADTATPYDVWSYIMTTASGSWPGTGTKTLYWTFSYAPTEGGTVVIFFVKNIDTTAPIRATAKSNLFTSWTPTLSNVKAADLTFMVLVDYLVRTTTVSGTLYAYSDSDNTVKWKIGDERGQSGPTGTTDASTYVGAIAFVLAAKSINLVPAEGYQEQFGDNADIQVFGAIDLYPAEGVQTQAGDNAALVQQHNLSPQEGAQTQFGDNAVIALTIGLLPNEGAQDQAGDAAALTQIHRVTPAEGVQTQFGDGAVLTQVHVLAPQEGAQTQSGDQATLEVGVIALTPQEGAQTQAGDNAALTQVHNLHPDEGYALQFGDQATLGVIVNLLANEGVQTQAGDTPRLYQQHNVQASEGAQDQLGDSPSLTQVHNLHPQEGAQEQFGDVGKVDAGTPLYPDEGSQGQFGDTPTLHVGRLKLELDLLPPQVRMKKVNPEQRIVRAAVQGDRMAGRKRM